MIDEELHARLVWALIQAETDRTLVWGNREIASLLLPVVRQLIDLGAAEALRDFADLIDRGPTFPLSSGIFSAMARERADDLCAEGEK